MHKRFNLPLLAALPLIATACGPSDDIDLSSYKRKSFKSQAECQAHYRNQISKGLTNPCQKTSRSGGSAYFGPYYFAAGGQTRYLGYRNDGRVSTSGVNFSGAKYTGSYSAPTVSRGGLSTSARAGSSVGS